MVKEGNAMNNKIKALLQLHGKTLTSYAKFTNRSQANISNKVSRASWTLKDMIELGDFTDTRLAFIDKDGNVVMEFNKDDLKDKSNS